MVTQLTVKDIVTRRREATRVSHPLMFSAFALIDAPPHKNHASPTQGELTCVVLYYIDLRRVVVMYYSCMYIYIREMSNLPLFGGPIFQFTSCSQKFKYTSSDS